jgi:predicted nuclease of predicted toxin-antitoxin system
VRFLADESCDFGVVRALRQAGHDVRAVCECALGAEDTQVIRLAVQDGRILLTEDKDFGRVVYVSGREHGGVILLRYPATARTRACGDVVALVERLRDRLVGHFVVAQPGRVRIL